MVTDVSGLEPKEWFFDRYRPGEDRTEAVYVMSYQEEEMEILSAEIEPEESADSYQVEVVAVAQNELPDSTAKVGYRVDVTPKAKLALGPIHDWVLLKNHH